MHGTPDRTEGALALSDGRGFYYCGKKPQVGRWLIPDPVFFFNVSKVTTMISTGAGFLSSTCMLMECWDFSNISEFSRKKTCESACKTDRSHVLVAQWEISSNKHGNLNL